MTRGHILPNLKKHVEVNKLAVIHDSIMYFYFILLYLKYTSRHINLNLFTFFSENKIPWIHFLVALKTCPVLTVLWYKAWLQMPKCIIQCSDLQKMLKKEVGWRKELRGMYSVFSEKKSLHDFFFTASAQKLWVEFKE